jgi:hypothetical protein
MKNTIAVVSLGVAVNCFPAGLQPGPWPKLSELLLICDYPTPFLGQSRQLWWGTRFVHPAQKEFYVVGTVSDSALLKRGADDAVFLDGDRQREHCLALRISKVSDLAGLLDIRKPDQALSLARLATRVDFCDEIAIDGQAPSALEVKTWSSPPSAFFLPSVYTFDTREASPSYKYWASGFEVIKERWHEGYQAILSDAMAKRIGLKKPECVRRGTEFEITRMVILRDHETSPEEEKTGFVRNYRLAIVHEIVRKNGDYRLSEISFRSTPSGLVWEHID